jgi:hypothetical protein
MLVQRDKTFQELRYNDLKKAYNKNQSTTEVYSVHLLILFPFPFLILRSLTQHSVITNLHIFLPQLSSFLLVYV